MDERSCIHHKDTEKDCFGDRLKCLDGIMCVNNEFKCDGTEDCKDGSDEICGKQIRTIITLFSIS